MASKKKRRKRKKKRALKIILIEGHKLNEATGLMEPVCIKLKWYG